MARGPEQTYEFEHQPNISKVHFLIHPGYLSRARSAYWDKGAQDKVLADALLDKYIEKAKTLRDDELMFAFLSGDKKLLRDDIQTEKIYTVKLEQLKVILDKRLIVLNFENIDRSDEVMELATRLAAARGFYFSKNVLSEAYGELLGACVSTGARNLNKSAGLSKKTVLRPELTDMGIIGGFPPKDIDFLRENLKHSRVDIEDAERQSPTSSSAQ